jgi:hypothetical protein
MMQERTWRDVLQPQFCFLNTWGIELRDFDRYFELSPSIFYFLMHVIIKR